MKKKEKGFFFEKKIFPIMFPEKNRVLGGLLGEKKGKKKKKPRVPKMGLEKKKPKPKVFFPGNFFCLTPFFFCQNGEVGKKKKSQIWKFIFQKNMKKNKKKGAPPPFFLFFFLQKKGEDFDLEK